MAGYERPRIIRTVEPRFPDELKNRAIYDGEVRTVVLIDGDGRLADWLLTSYTHPIFAREASEVLQQWRFEPARRHGEPVDVRTEIVFVFHASGGIVSVRADDQADRFQRRGTSTETEKVCRPSDLDSPLTPTQTVRPLWPEGWGGETKEGRVVLEFFVDQEGRPRMPVVLSTDHDLLVLAAVEALSRWRFEPPTRRGEPVLVRATQSFRFHRRG